MWALSSRGLSALGKSLRGEKQERKRREWEDDENRRKYENEKVVKDIRYYARNCGFDVEEQEVETKDGYLLKVFKVVCLNKRGKIHSDGRRGFPVLIQHGLFQSCGSFITSEERSLAFWLAEHGLVVLLVFLRGGPRRVTDFLGGSNRDYQVYLGNNRGVFDMGHVVLKRSDPRFWGLFFCPFHLTPATINSFLGVQTTTLKNWLSTTSPRWWTTSAVKQVMTRYAAPLSLSFPLRY